MISFLIADVQQKSGSFVDGSDPLDRVIAIVIMLFILSAITEKLTQLVRTYPGQFRAIGILFCVAGYVSLGTTTGDLLRTNGDAVAGWTVVVLFVCITLLLAWIVANMDLIHPSRTTKTVRAFQVLQNVGKDTVVDDRVKEKEVTTLSFIVGFIVALTLKVNLIALFNGKVELGWGDVSIFKPGKILVIDLGHFDIDPLLIISFLLTAFFLAFGSKFFHDLLDNLLQIKNLKRKAIEKETYEVTSIREFDDQLAKTTYDKNAAAIAGLPGVTGVSFGRVRQDGSGRFGLKVFTSKPGLVLKSDLTRDINGNPVPVYIETDEEAQSVSVSAQVMNAKPGAEKGTICIGVRDINAPQNQYWLTCYHVVKTNSHDWTKFTASGSDDQVKIAEGLTGNIVRAERTEEMEAALIKPDSAVTFGNIVPAFNIPITSSRPTFYFDDDTTSVNVYGAITKQRRTGLITGLGARWKINFRDGLPGYEMINLIEIQKDGRTIVNGGDSGALIFTDKGEALGMVVASTKKRTLAIPIDTILSNWDLEIIT